MGLFQVIVSRYQFPVSSHLQNITKFIKLSYVRRCLNPRDAQREREREKEREKEGKKEKAGETRLMTAELLELVLRSLIYTRERATSAAAVHMENGLHEYANWSSKRRASSASCAARISNIRARLQKARPSDNTSYK